MYPFLGLLSVLGLVGLIVFGVWSKMDENNNAVLALTLVSIVLLFVGGCGALATQQDYSIEVAQQKIAEQFDVRTSEVTIESVTCFASSRYGCNTWEGVFHVGQYSGLVHFDSSSATIIRYWEGDLPPIGAFFRALV